MHAVTQDITDNIDKLVDENQLTQEIAQHPDNILPILKKTIDKINEGLKQRYQSGSAVESIIYGRANLIDKVLTSTFKQLLSEAEQTISLVAVGGYGRGELHPGSDIDLMLLLRDKESEATKNLIEKFLLLLWDSKLEIGHSVRTLADCVDESSNDITVATNIMEARLITGDAALFDEMKQMTGPDRFWDDQSFFQAKLKEQIQRNGKYNDTAYNLEPNIKESRGGLRDIQMIGWVAKRHFGADSMQDLVTHGFLRQDELDTLLKGQHLLWRIRCSLHYLANRREDRLLFDYQRQLALEFGFEDGANNLAIEQFMQQYYRNVMELERLNEMLLQLFQEAILYANEPGEIISINESFQMRHGYIEARNDKLFIERPVALLEIFYVMQQYPEIQGVRAETIRLLCEHRHLIDDKFRASSETRKIFIKIMSYGRGLTHELRRMNSYGILAAYIPAFELITGRMQYDLFHAYTVDQHILFVIRNMRRMSLPEHSHELPLASGVFHHLKKPELLYLSGLFHDIAKGRDGDHSELGAVDALEFCTSHGLSQDDAQLVSWLVRQHLVMSMTAQRKDLSDPEIISEFAEIVGTIEKLDYLYLLTISDIRGTNPGQWNSWKDKLLIELYNKTAVVLHKGLDHQLNKEESILHNKTAALRTLERGGLNPQQISSIWSNLTDEYFLAHTPSEIIWHTQLIHADQEADTPLVKARIDTQTASMELFVYMRTKGNIFENIVSQIGQVGLNIVGAQIIRCSNEHSLETFKIISNDNKEHQLIHAIHDIVPKLQQKLSSEHSETSAIPWDTPRRHRHFEIKTLVEFEKNLQNNTTRMHIDTMDRPGVLAIIAKAFIDSDVHIHSATISTAGEKAIDYFDITNKDSGSALSVEQQKQLESVLMEQL